MLLFGTLLSTRQQIIGREVSCGELVTESFEEFYPGDNLVVLEPMLKLVAKDTETDAIEGLANFNNLHANVFDPVVKIS